MKLARLPKRDDASPRAWRGDEHRLEVDSAREVGLSPREIALSSFHRGFVASGTVRDPWDGALVARGRTPLRDEELVHALEPLLRRIGVPRERCQISVLDGAFELRVPARVVESALPALAGARQAIGLWIGFAMASLFMWQLVPHLLLLGAWTLASGVAALQVRRGIRESRTMLFERMTEALASYAQTSQLILPLPERGSSPAQPLEIGAGTPERS